MLAENRMSKKIAEIRERIETLDEAEREKLDATLAVEFDEHFAYQQAQARAHVSGLISTDEAQVIYTALGEVGSADNGGWAAGTDTATKVVVTLAMGELIAA